MANEEVQSPNDVSPTQQTQTALDETNVESQEPEAVREPSVSPNKRGLKSVYWRHYKRQKFDGKFKAICKYCDKKLGGETTNGTSHLKDHLSICAARNKRSPMQALLKVSEVPGKGKESFVAGTYTFNQDISRTVASESAFSTSGRDVTPQRSRLKEDTLEALMCSQNWFRTEMQGYSKIYASFECVDEDMDDDEEMSQT